MITDAISMHSIWYLDDKKIDKYFVIDTYSKEIFKKKFSHKRDNVVVSFFPIEEDYFINKKKIDNKNIYILLSSLNENFVFELFERLSQENINVHILKGRNQLTFDILQNEYAGYNQFKFYNTFDLKKHYKDIDLFIGKA